MELKKVGLGGGCHWCTEAVFSSLKDVAKVEQGFINSKEESTYSEAVIVHFDNTNISLRELIEIHLYTHKSTSNHSMRSKYRSAVYVIDANDFESSKRILEMLQEEFEDTLVTEIHNFQSFKPSLEQFHNYYYTDSQKHFCTAYITPKLSLLLKNFGKFTDSEKVKASISPKVISK